MDYALCLLRWGPLRDFCTRVLLLAGLLTSSTAYATAIFINEFHYENVSADIGEGVEVAGPADTDLSDWSLVFYRDNGTFYDALQLSGTIPKQQNGFGAIGFFLNPIQNGPADGFALVARNSSVVQFLSYEGTLTAVDGAAAGMTSTDIGKSETSTTPEGLSLQLAGFGSLYEDFFWTDAKPNSFGEINSGQNFAAQPPVPAPEPGSLVLFGIAGTALMLRKRIIS